ncbi:hypothetical protein ACVVIH_04000 [Chryseobacterium arthrosphaerae]|uniref:hypothetical protein n=1 Tax=Chryseobacterium arthrosphaerae TaxID=651561 RepID=UPI003D331754
MQKIKIIFNKESFKEPFKEEEITLISSFQYNDKITIQSNIEDITFKNKNELTDFFNRIRGSDINNLKLKFYEEKFIKWAHADFYEQQTFKSLLLLYKWLEPGLTGHENTNIKRNFYNEFVVDWNYTPTIQNTIYLIDEKYMADVKNTELLNVLLKLNLLCKIILSTNTKDYINYFIPLLTPGVPLEYFKSNNDSTGMNANRLWKELLKDRDIRLNTWIKNRF